MRLGLSRVSALKRFVPAPLKALVRRALGRVPPQGPFPPQLEMRLRFDRVTPASREDVRAPYRIVRYRPGDEARWIDLLGSGEFDAWDAARLKSEILSSLIPESAVFAEREGRLVACAALCQLQRFSPLATLMYVVTRAEDRGRGLGTIVTREAVETARSAGYPGVALLTDPHRLAAIRTYLSLGFEPVDDTVDARARWAAVTTELGARS